MLYEDPNINIAPKSVYLTLNDFLEKQLQKLLCDKDVLRKEYYIQYLNIIKYDLISLINSNFCMFIRKNGKRCKKLKYYGNYCCHHYNMIHHESYDINEEIDILTSIVYDLNENEKGSRNREPFSKIKLDNEVIYENHINKDNFVKKEIINSNFSNIN